MRYAGAAEFENLQRCLRRGEALGSLRIDEASPSTATVMADNLKERAPQDASRIILNEEWEVRYWTRTLGVDKARLEELVSQHGNSADSVRRAIGK